MKALCWNGPKNVQIENVPDPKILNAHDAIIKVKSSAICGSDLHMFDGFVLGMQRGDVLGHEFAGEVVAVGTAVKNLREGDRVVVPFNISCGRCYYCIEELWSLCDNTNPNGAMLAKELGYPSGGLYGYSHLYGGYSGGQAEYVRVPFADVNPMKIPDEIQDYEDVLFLSDIMPTAYMAAENCSIRQGDVVAVWGCGPVGLLSIVSAYMLGARRVIAIDRVPERLALARSGCGAEVIDYTRTNVQEALMELTDGAGPNSCIEAVGSEAHGLTLDAKYDRAAQKLGFEQDRSHALREAIHCCAKGGTVSIPGVYTGMIDRFPMGIAFGKGLTFKMGQTHVRRYMHRLLERILDKQLDTKFIISHRIGLDDVPQAYAKFCNKEDCCTKVVITP